VDALFSLSRIIPGWCGGHSSLPGVPCGVHETLGAWRLVALFTYLSAFCFVIFLQAC
jgi:hypothetical protein